MSIEKLLDRWQKDSTIANCIEAFKFFPEKPGMLSTIPEWIHPVIQTSLKNSGIESLYSHQIEALNAINKGENVVITTGTASGKSLCYNLAFVESMLHDYESRALYIFPTKALCQDQAQKLRQFLLKIIEQPKTESLLELKRLVEQTNVIGIYDGDTPASSRKEIRQTSRVILTNPDMLHLGILPHHTNWVQFFKYLHFVVIDEIHLYRGIFGSHVANVIRRFKRVAAFYGVNPQFIMTSATIANPSALAKSLIEENVIEINQDGSPHGKKSFLIYNPPILNKDLGIRRSSMQETERLTEDLLTYDIQTLVFARSRRSVELLLTYLRNRMKIDQHPSSKDQKKDRTIRGYRSGYLAHQRREIEAQLHKGIARVVVATNALELGIDVGELAAVVLMGYPGSISSTLQQSGRAGRKQEPALAVLIATSDPLDQFLTRHPEYIFEKPVENALINPNNLLLLLSHLKCAAFELPFSENQTYGNLSLSETRDFLDILCQENYLYSSGGKYIWLSDKYPAQTISLRSILGEQILLNNSENGAVKTIGVLDRYSTNWLAHPGAIYFHESTPYLVEALDLENNFASLSLSNADYYTEPRSESALSLIKTSLEQEIHGKTSLIYKIGFGELVITKQLVGYKKTRLFTGESLGIFECVLPPIELKTTGYWIILSDSVISHLRDQGLWSNDPNRYGTNWEKVKYNVRQRDGFQCQSCGRIETDQAHDVHHRMPFRWFKTNEEANRLENLVTLCPKCHQYAELNVKIQSGLAGLSYIVAHLAPLFLMCDTHDIGVHSDPKSSTFSNQSVVVIYDQYPDGIGLSYKLYEVHHDLITNCYETISACTCTDGCPSCVGPGGENGSGGKIETLAILNCLKYDG